VQTDALAVADRRALRLHIDIINQLAEVGFNCLQPSQYFFIIPSLQKG
jgi:hypothetical protein